MSKRKATEAAPARNAKHEAEEEDFPRGGKSALSASEIQEARAEAEAEAEAEFSRDEETKQVKKRKQEKGMFLDPDAVTLGGSAPKAVDFLKFKELAEGMRVLAAVSEINVTDIAVSLPNGLHGFVKAEEACTECAELNKDGKQDKDKIQRLLKELFQVGQLVACTVLHIQETKTNKPKRAILSLLPQNFNDGLTIDSVSNGQLMVASVKSVEDHGYILSFGVRGISGFLLHKDCAGDIKFRIGQIIQASASAVDKKRGVVNLSMNKISTMKNHENLAFGGLVPGALIKARVQGVINNGVLLSFLTYFTGTADVFHLESEFPGKHWAENYTEGKQFRARLLSTDPKTKSVRLSLRSHLLQNNLLIPSVNKGDCFEAAVVKRIDPGLGLLLELPGASSAVAGYVNLSDASDKNIEKLEKKFHEGQKVKARVTSFRLLDGLATVSLKESVFKGVMNKLDLKAGMVVHGLVSKLEAFGAFVTLGEDARALCPLQHMCEYNRSKPSARFKVGAQLKFRILQFDLQKKKLIVTQKKTMVSSKLPPLTSYDDAVHGLVTHGWIQGIGKKDGEEYGCFVEFYNHVRGLVHRSELGIDSAAPIESAFQVGQVVKCRVLTVEPRAQRLSLSFIVSPRSLDIEVGSTVSAVVTSVGNYELELQVASPKGSVCGTMSYQHLSDTPVHVEQMKPLLKPGYEFDRLLVLDNRGSKLILTAKHSLLEAGDSLPSSLNQLSPQQVIPGFISSIHEKSCIVHFLGELNGLVLIRNASDTFVEDLSKVFQVGQSVRSQVLEVDVENGKCLLCLKQSACFSINVSLIEGYFLEEEKIARLKEVESAWAKSLRIGEVIAADVQEIKDYGIILNIKDHADVVGFATHFQSDQLVKSGEILKAAILDIVKADGIVDLSLQKKMITSSSKEKKVNQVLKLHQKVQAVVELVKDEYLVLTLPDFDNAIGYASTRDYNLRKLRPHDYYVPGQRLTATIYNTSSVGGRLLLLITDALAPTLPNLPKTPLYEIGSLVEGQVLEITPLYMLVEVGRSLRGKVHITEVTDKFEAGHPFRRYAVGQTVRAKILAKHKPSRTKKHPVTLDLSLRLSENSGVITFETLSVGQSAIGYVQEVTEEWAWILLGPRVRGRLHVLHASDDLSQLEHFKDRFKVGEAVQCYVVKIGQTEKTLDLSVLPVTWTGNETKQIKEGDVLPGRISRVLEGVGGVSVQLGPSIFGKVHVTHLGDSWLDNPAALFTPGKFVKCRVLEVKKTFNGKTGFQLSLRPSLGGAGGFESLPSFQQQQKSPARIVNSIKDLQPRMNVQGFVKVVTEKGCFLALAPDLDARVLLKNLSDLYLPNPSQSFPVGKLVTGRVLSVEPLSGRVEMTLTSAMETDAKDLSDFNVGDVVSGIIRRIEKFGIFINLAGSDIVGLCHTSEASDDFIPDLAAAYKVGQRVPVKVLKIDAEKKRVSLGMKESYLAGREPEDDDGDEDLIETEVGDDPMELDEQTDLNLDVEVTAVNASVEPLEVDLEEELEEKMVTDDEIPSPQETKKQGKKEKKRLKEEREAAIRSAEERLLQNDQPPETVDDFERLVRSSPNSSYVWIKYMAFWLRLADPDKAREVAERALETINFREELEKLNVWTAYLNLENSFGSSPKEAVSALFERALKFCDPKKLHLALLGIYEKSNMHDMTDALTKSMTRKFRTSTKVWLRHISNLLSRGLEDKSRKAFDQALLGLPRYKHIKFIAPAAVLEFKSGSAERAREIFDGVLRNYPKRTDLWSVYLDQEIRLGDVAIIRELFERVTCLDLPPKKMKFLFSKYLNFEKAQGDEAQIEHVKRKANEYVEAKAG